ncbi:hypothetical protein P5815_21895 [Bacillus cereus]|uniref:hypothetical protein n=1 Tax=Bacillus cereus TaxID=1396 RepID=UPI002405F38F|nr:hypothetical protein [Bacillus cereus]MDF9523184.1 hypothetical protein [Bacillus cereus]MDF9561880.1 hypothetical protein [Bacillus cereus]
MKLDLTLSIAAIFTSLTTLGLFFFLHYCIEPKKEARRKKSEKFKNFYAPLYLMINARLSHYIFNLEKNGRDAEQMYFSDVQSYGKPAFIDNAYVIRFVLENSSYASTELLDELEYYIYDVSEQLETGDRHKHLVEIIVKEYQQLRKELKMDYDEEALKTGFPKRIRSLKKK